MATRFLAHLRRNQVAYLVLILALIPTYVAFSRVRAAVKAREQARFDRFVVRTQVEVERGINRCLDQMYNIRALFAANSNVGRNQWKAYLTTMSVRHSELGIRSLGYVEKVTPATRDAFLNARRKDTHADFVISPPGERPLYFPSVFITHFDWEAELLEGLDHAVRPERAAVMKQAIEQNRPCATERVHFMDRGGLHAGGGCFFYLPVYRNDAVVTNLLQRNDALQGLIYLTIIPQQLLQILLENQDKSELAQVDIEVYDSTNAVPDRLFYDSDQGERRKPGRSRPALSRNIILPVLNQRWMISFFTTPEFDANSPRYLQWLVLGSGALLGLLLFGITWVQVNARARAERDTAELQKSETALATEKELLAVTFDSIADGVITTNAAGRILTINKAGQSLTGWTESESQGKPLSEVFRLIHEQTREPGADPVRKVVETRAALNAANHSLLVDRSGLERVITSSAAPILDLDGSVMGVVLVFRDITERRKAEEQMLKESKLESVGLLAGGIAHDFNNILLGIVGSISLARTPPHSLKDILDLLADVEKSALRAKDLTQQLLTFAKGGAPVKRPIHLADLIRESCQFALRGSNVASQFSLASDAWAVEVDEGQVRQVFNNLVINARQAMPQGGSLEVSLENVLLEAGQAPPLPPGKYVKISIRDHGTGIAPEHLPRIFEPYFTTKSHGSGLGLATSYSVIRKHDGQIKVESSLGAGTTFHIYLPASFKPVAPSPAGSPPRELSGRGRVLIMDDEEAIRKILSAMLQKFGYEVETTCDGNQAAERYEAARAAGRPFDAVIMDLTIPNGLGGRETIERLRKLDPNVKAIVSSGYSLDPIMANYRQYGFAAVIPKPFQVEELGRILKDVIR